MDYIFQIISIFLGVTFCCKPIFNEIKSKLWAYKENVEKTVAMEQQWRNSTEIFF